MLHIKPILEYIGETNIFVSSDAFAENAPPKYLNKYEFVNGIHLNAIDDDKSILHVMPPKNTISDDTNTAAKFLMTTAIANANDT